VPNPVFNAYSSAIMHSFNNLFSIAQVSSSMQG
jgi:hypothetical protein